MAISFVGSTSGSAIDGGNVTLDLTTISGLAENDLVIVAYAAGDNDSVDSDMSMVTAGYAEIADLYDSLVQSDDDIPFFVERAGMTAGPVIELMAGTGRVSVPLLERGIALTCVDASPEMLAHLRAKIFACGLEATLLCADVRRLDQHRWLRDSFALGLIAFKSLSELVEETDRVAALRCARDCRQRPRLPRV